MNTKLISILLCVTVFFSLPAAPVAEAPVTDAPSAEFTVIAASDFQPKSSFGEGVKNVRNIISAIQDDGITSADGFLFCGDYDAHTYGQADKTKAGIDMFKDEFEGMIDPEDMYFVQGNHDASPAADVGLSPFGNNDPEGGDYGVFVIHNDDYMWANKDEQRIKQTAQKLIEYLNEKLSEGYNKPIFVISHLPLHYTMRTRNDGDGKYARYLFDALNEAGEKGLNIVFMYGHDHSNGWDDYLGGASVYLEKGDEMLVADFSSSVYSYKTLNFTYLNAGFTGYYDNHNGADDTLTMTLFRVKGDTMTVSRYSKDGIHVLKSAGFTNKYKNETGYSPNKTVYESPRTVKLTKVTDTALIEDLIEVTEEGKVFKRIMQTSELVSGDRYLLVCARASNRIMLPKSVSKSNSSGTRIGFDLTDSSAYVDDTIFGEYDNALWTFTQKNGKWLIGDGEKYAKFTSTSSNKITATLESAGDLFTVSGSGQFTFISDHYCLNYNSRGLVNGYDSDPAEYFIFKYVGYSIAAKDCEIIVDGGSMAEYAIPGEAVTVKLKSVPAGKRFNGWQILKGDVEIDDPAADEISFVMPKGPVKLVATYKDIKVGDVNDDGRVTNSDVICIYRYIFNPEKYPVYYDVADVNRDGEITNVDVLYIYRHIFSPERYPLG